MALVATSANGSAQGPKDTAKRTENVHSSKTQLAESHGHLEVQKVLADDNQTFGSQGSMCRTCQATHPGCRRGGPHHVHHHLRQTSPGFLLEVWSLGHQISQAAQAPMSRGCHEWRQVSASEAGSRTAPHEKPDMQGFLSAGCAVHCQSLAGPFRFGPALSTWCPP